MSDDSKISLGGLFLMFLVGVGLYNLINLILMISSGIGFGGFLGFLINGCLSFPVISFSINVMILWCLVDLK